VAAAAPDEPHVYVLPVRLPRFGPAKWYFHYYLGLRRRIAAIDPHVLHVWEEPWSLAALQVVLLRNRLARSVPLVLEVEQNILKRLPPPFEQIRGYVLRNTDYLLARSAEALAVVRRKGYAGRASLINHVLDQTIFVPRSATSTPIRGAGEELTIGYVGRLVVEKGLDDVLDAISICAKPARLRIMGDGPYRDRLLARVRELNLGDRVSFLQWSEPRGVAEFIKSLDVLVLMTRTTKAVKEQFGRVIIEAHGCGVPVIGSTCGAIPRVIGEGGWIVPECDPTCLARLLDEIAARPELLAAAARRGLQQVERLYSPSVVGKTLAEAWRTALQDQPIAVTSVR
jgi:glycosyltransferase involved in cell wall biosynthesis